MLLCDSLLFFGMCSVVIWLFFVLVGVLNILKLIFFIVLVNLVNLSCMCRFGLFELKCVIVFEYGIIGNFVLSLMLIVVLKM